MSSPVAQTQRIVGQYFRGLRHDDGGVLEGYDLERCIFQSCSLSMTTIDPARRSIVRSVRLKDCITASSHIGCAVFDEVEVDGLDTSGDGVFLWAPAFRHVTFRGKVDRIKINRHYRSAPVADTTQRQFDDANRAFYESVDWALDLRELDAKDFDVQGVPARLVRRDPETQVVVTRERVMRGEWRHLDLSKTYWDILLASFLKSGATDRVLVAPKRSKDFKALKAGLDLLRDAGVAELD